MKPAVSLVGPVVFFGLAGPLVGMLAFYLFIVLSTKEVTSFPIREILGSYQELGLPALIAGALFAVVLALWPRRGRSIPGRLWLSASGGLAMLLVFGLPYVQGLIFQGHIRPVGVLLSVLALVVGAVLGAVIPRVLVPSPSAGRHGV